MENPHFNGWFGGKTPIFGNTQIFFLGGAYERRGGEEIVELVMYFFVWKPFFYSEKKEGFRLV